MLTEYVRNALRRTISAINAELDENGRSRLYCVTLDPALEDVVNGYIDRGPGGTTMSIPPNIATKLAQAVSATAEPLVGAGHQLVVLTSPVLTRLYTPEDFGVLAVYASIVSVLVVVTSLRYELAIPLPADDNTAANLLLLALAIVVALTLLNGLGIWLLGGRIGWWLPPTSRFGGRRRSPRNR